MDIKLVCRQLGYEFEQPDLLRQALTHRSYGVPHNERLEFLGDSVLNCVTAVMLYRFFPGLPEGDLSRLRASLVNKQTLFEVAQSLNIGEQILLGEGELKSGGGRRPSILSDSIEAILGAVFLDGGFAQAEAVIARLFEPFVARLNPKTLDKDAKTLLQEYLQSRKMSLPQYLVTATYGEAHEQAFCVECVVTELSIRCSGEGSSRRNAEQHAARLAYQLAKGH